MNGRLPPSAAESVLRIRSTLATNGVSTRVRRTLRRASRTTLHSGARTAREICQDHSRDYSGPHAGVRRNGTATAAHPTFRGRKDLSFNGLRDFRRRFRPARARASGDERARHPPGARFARIAYSPVRRSRVPRGPARLAPRARRATPDRRSHMPCMWCGEPRRARSTSFEKPKGLAFELFSRESLRFATFRISRKEP